MFRPDSLHLFPHKFLLTLSYHLLPSFIGQSFCIRQCLTYVLFTPLSLLLCPWRFLIVCFSSPSCLIGISHMALFPTQPSSSSSSEVPSTAAHSVAWGSPTHSDRFGSGNTIVGKWQIMPKIKRSSCLLLGSAWVGRMGVGPLSGLRSSRMARRPTHGQVQSGRS
jgi:hypothetical protein